MASTARAVKFVIADAFPVFSDGLLEHLPEHFPGCTIDRTDSEKEFVHLLNRCNDAVVFLGTNACQNNVSLLCREILKSHRGLRVIVVAHAPDGVFIESVFSAGASGCLSYFDDMDEIVYAVKLSLKGKLYESRKYLEQQKQSGGKGNESQQLFTPREKEVLQLLCKAQSNKEIAGELHISIFTVNGHVRHLLKKAGVRNRVELQNYARQNGLV